MPKPPMKTTMILSPLPNEMTNNELQNHRNNFIKLSGSLNNINLNSEHPALNYDFDQFLDYLGISTEEYINAIRSSLKCEAIFLKRKVSHMNINGFNHNMLK